MTPSEWLEQRGWKKVREIATGEYANTFYWTHSDHQPSRRGFFTTTDAVGHQKYVEKYKQCTCVPKEFKLHE